MIHYDGKKRIFKLDTPHTSYIIGVVDEENFIGMRTAIRRCSRFM